MTAAEDAFKQAIVGRLNELRMAHAPVSAPVTVASLPGLCEHYLTGPEDEDTPLRPLDPDSREDLEDLVMLVEQTHLGVAAFLEQARLEAALPQLFGGVLLPKRGDEEEQNGG